MLASQEASKSLALRARLWGMGKTNLDTPSAKEDDFEPSPQGGGNFPPCALINGGIQSNCRLTARVSL
jgi:hypothetical protein